MGSQFRAELDEFVRRLRMEEDRARGLNLRAQGIEQGLRDLWQPPTNGGTFRRKRYFFLAAGGFSPQRTPIGTSVHIVDHDTGFDYGTFTQTTNPANGYLECDFVVSGTTFNPDVTVTPPSVRFDTPSLYNPGPISTIGQTFDQLGMTGSLTPATGFRFQTYFDLPLASTLKIDDSARGTTGTTLSPSGSGTWGGSNGGTSYIFGSNGTAGLKVTITIGGVPQGYTDAAITSITYPADPSTKMTVTLAVTGGTVTVYEP